MTHPQDYFAGKVVLVTGAGGSIGSQICRRLVQLGVDELRMVGHSEAPLYEVQNTLSALTFKGCPLIWDNHKVILASCTDGKAMAAACEGVDIVIHAAAHKHVPLCEQNPIEAIANNVGGTVELAHAASRAGVKQFVMVSSDKAVKPSSVMGATKRACELFLQFLSTRSSTKFTTVRFGNVLDSSGSVLPLWREQIKAGKDITLTDARCTRYFMSIQDAVDLTLGAASLPRGGTYVLDMGAPRSLYMMAEQLLRELNPPPWDAEIGGKRPKLGIHMTGLRPGEKIHEELTYGGEQVKTTIPRVFSLREDGARHILNWNDFSDLIMAAKCRHRDMALDKLREIVR
jgi:FlaA1/EpsC-like NDP-sugar epimerase